MYTFAVFRQYLFVIMLNPMLLAYSIRVVCELNTPVYHVIVNY